ncbi:hypothetical protein OH77DRAFT_1090086 [Trametes cingulata]|nr:hypothetical protein OH77DRAFT_1090086 [Trametes cingulata]
MLGMSYSPGWIVGARHRCLAACTCLPSSVSVVSHVGAVCVIPTHGLLVNSAQRPDFATLSLGREWWALGV